MRSKMLTTEEKENIAIMTAQGLTPNAIGNALHRDRKTVVAALQKPEVMANVADFSERLSVKLESRFEEIIDAISESDIEKASLRDKAISAGVLLDKCRLIKGQSTSNHFILQAAIEAACEDD